MENKKMLVILLILIPAIKTLEISVVENYIPTYFLNSSKLIESKHLQMLYDWINYGKKS
jgi:hypothetical protein